MYCEVLSVSLITRVLFFNLLGFSLKTFLQPGHANKESGRMLAQHTFKKHRTRRQGKEEEEEDKSRILHFFSVFCEPLACCF